MKSRKTKNELKYELALEVENSIKTKSRIEEMLKSYQFTFNELRYLCAGVLIVACTKSVYRAYENAISQMPEDFRARVILASDFALKNLKATAFGNRLEQLLHNPHQTAEMVRSDSSQGIQYFPMKSANVFFSGVSLGAYGDSSQ